MRARQPWIADAPDELWANLNVTGGNPPTCTITGCFVGTAGAVNPMLDALPAPTYRTVQTLNYLDAMHYFAGGPKNRESFVASSRMLMTPVRDPSTIVDAATGHPNLHLIIDALGGAVGRVAPGDTAFPYRSALASVQIYLKTTPAAQADATGQVQAVRDQLGPVVGSAAYVNYIDATMPNWADSYYGANLPRLRTVAHTYDPDKVFTFAQAVNEA
ncbi:MAG TPA: BBE domain-containing protein [Pseudonocardiaceae bacterium]